MEMLTPNLSTGTAEELEKRNEAEKASKEKKMQAEAEFLEMMEKTRWDDRQNRLRRWEKKDTENQDDERCNCQACVRSRRDSWSSQESEDHGLGP